MSELSSTKEWISGFCVHYPYEAYGTQKIFMGNLLKALRNGQNALLEAPTGEACMHGLLRELPRDL